MMSDNHFNFKLDDVSVPVINVTRTVIGIGGYVSKSINKEFQSANELIKDTNKAMDDRVKYLRMNENGFNLVTQIKGWI